MDNSMQSSPDPLNASQSFHPPPKARRTSRVRSSLPMQGSSPKKQTFELDVGNELSPQKIRVTVEAGESDVEHQYRDFKGRDAASPTPGPAHRRRERTTTTTVPVKGLSDSEEGTQQVATPKRGRGRPRKSAGTPVPAKKKNARRSTPTQRGGRRKSIGELVDGDDEDDVNFELGKSVEVHRGIRRSRSRSRKAAKSTSGAETRAVDNGTSSAVSKKGRGRRKSILPEEVEVLEDESCRSNSDRGRASESAGPTGSLGANDGNSQSSLSPYSTVRSTAHTGVGEPDVVIARFEPVNETPRKTGWSSPRVIDGPQPSSSRKISGNYPSPSLSPDKMGLDHSQKRALEAAEDQFDENEYEEEAEDDVGEFREFDTILESEGFSMISVDSVPSLRQHLSSPADQAVHSSGKPLRNKNFLAVQEMDTSAYNDSFSEIPEEILAAATPAKLPQNQRLISVQNARVDDSLSSIAPEILEAATPAHHQTSTRPTHNTFSSKLNNTSTQASSRKGPSPATNVQWNEDYEDSFSIIPQAILDAATPAAVRQDRSGPDTLGVSGPRLGESHATSPSRARLLTPEESLSPPADNSNTNEAAVDESSFMYSHLPSSPPSIAPRRYTYTAHLRQRRQLNPDTTQTPSIVFSSPSLPPPIQPGRGHATLAPALEQSQRPALSPIARAGRMLQDIAVPSSPRSRSQSLGSPFKSPAAERRSSSIIAQQTDQSALLERRAGPLPKLDLSSHFSGSSSQRQRVNVRHEDPFNNHGSRQQRSPSPEERQQYSLGLPQHRQYSDPRLSNLKSEAESVHSDNDMSWQAEEEISVPVQSTSTNELLSEHQDMPAEEKWSAERAEVIKQVESAGANQLIVLNSDDEGIDDEDIDNEGFGQLLETLNSSSPAVPKTKEPAREITEKPRRSKIPSPWRKNSKRLVYSDELSHISSPSIPAKPSLAKDLANKVTSQPVTVRRVLSTELSDDTNSADFSGWQIPQKSNFKPQPRATNNVDLSALLSASPPKRLPVLSKVSQQPAVQQESSLDKPSLKDRPSYIEPPRERSSGFAPIPQKSGFNPRPRAGSSSPIKMPALGPNLISGISRDNQINTPPEPSSSSPVSRPLSSSSPSRTNTLPACRTPSAQVSPLNNDQGSSLISTSEKENQTNSRTLKWTESLQVHKTRTFIQTSLPPPNSSPAKSCLRSPLKTPSAQTSSSENVSPSKAVAFVSSSPMPSSPQAAPLSSTTWSKAHWTLLDSILQQWKPENQDSSPLSDGCGGKEKRRRNSTRVISRLLGKTVSSEGEKLRLEQWHLEVVDEFRGMVPGWEEQVVAMRVFSLVVGEEKRALRLKARSVRC